MLNQYIATNYFLKAAENAKFMRKLTYKISADKCSGSCKQEQVITTNMLHKILVSIDRLK